MGERGSCASPRHRSFPTPLVTLTRGEYHPLADHSGSCRDASFFFLFLSFLLFRKQSVVKSVTRVAVRLSTGFDPTLIPFMAHCRNVATINERTRGKRKRKKKKKERKPLPEEVTICGRIHTRAMRTLARVIKRVAVT